MEKITSAQNPLIKKLVQLSKKASSRKKTGQTILDGVHLCEEYLVKVGAPEICVVASGAESGEVAKIVEQCLAKNVRIIELPKSLFEKISPLVEGIGVLFVVKVSHENEFNSKVNSLILENIQDPGNLGAILRSAVAFGVEQIICSPGTVSAWSPKVLRAGMGAHFAVKIFENQDLAEVISKLEIPVLATSLEAKKSIYEEDLSGAQAWIFGNEGKGVSAETQKMATKKVIIPQSSKVESLNVAMAATVCLSESWRQNLVK
jgi:TrmH family RNA methyltransferase